MIAVGESQSAAFLTTLANAVHPLDPVFDGFLIHSRGANGAPLDGDHRRAGGRTRTIPPASRAEPSTSGPTSTCRC